MEVRSFNDFCEDAKRRGAQIIIITKDNECYCGDFIKFSSAHGHEYVHVLHCVEDEMINITDALGHVLDKYLKRSLRETPVRISDIEDYMSLETQQEEDAWNEQVKKNQIAYDALFAEM